jgi:hypothetical protein
MHFYLIVHNRPLASWSWLRDAHRLDAQIQGVLSDLVCLSVQEPHPPNPYNPVKAAITDQK